MVIYHTSKHIRKRKKNTRITVVQRHNLAYYKESMINPSKGAVELMML